MGLRGNYFLKDVLYLINIIIQFLINQAGHDKILKPISLYKIFESLIELKYENLSIENLKMVVKIMKNVLKYLSIIE